ncbi:MAG: hypothetical protein V4710_02555, partial [Verrucomicrobiota bacterium]
WFLPHAERSMKPKTFLIGVFFLAGAVFGILRLRTMPVPPENPSPTPAPLHPTEALKTVTEEREVFQRAFWRRPASDDRIVHAERREWSDAQGVTRWQWFLAVEPGAALLQWLAEDPFSLSKTAEPHLPAGGATPPEWFPRELGAFAAEQKGSGEFLLLRDRNKNLLFATDAGFGFKAGAKVAAPGLPDPAPRESRPSQSSSRSLPISGQ